MLDMFDNVWGDQDEIVVDHCADITVQVYLCLYCGSTGPEQVTRLHCPLSVLQVLSRLKLMCAIGVYFPNTAFGRRVSWRDDQVVPIGHQMTFKEALHIVSTDVVFKLLLPEWAMGLTQRLRNVRAAFEELEVGRSLCSFPNRGPGVSYIS
jgi:hypothetical protein